MSSLSKTAAGFPRAPASGCPSEVVRDQTRDKLGKDEEEIPRPLYLFVSLSAIFAYVVVYKVLHDIWSYWLGSLGETRTGIGAGMPPAPVVGRGPAPLCAFAPPLASALCVSQSPRGGTGGEPCSPHPLSQPVRAGLVSQLEPHPEHRCRVGSGRQRTAGALRSRGRTGTPAVSTAPVAARLTPALSDALLLKADTLPSEKSL